MYFIRLLIDLVGRHSSILLLWNKLKMLQVRIHIYKARTVPLEIFRGMSPKHNLDGESRPVPKLGPFEIDYKSAA